MINKKDYGNKYDFLDLGCKNGGSIEYCAKRFRIGKGIAHNAKGIGIDIDKEAVKRAKKAGYDAIRQDITKLKIKSKFKFVSALDFLEHLSGLESTEKVINKMSELASDFLFIRHPSFEDVEYLKTLGLKITWTDWDVHTAPIKIHDFANIFHKLGLRQYCFVYKKEIKDSDDDNILPLNAPVNTMKYDKSLGKKPKVTFEKKVYSQIDIFVALKPIDHKTWNWITRES